MSDIAYKGFRKDARVRLSVRDGVTQLILTGNLEQLEQGMIEEALRECAAAQ